MVYTRPINDKIIYYMTPDLVVLRKTYEFTYEYCSWHHCLFFKTFLQTYNLYGSTKQKKIIKKIK